MSRLSLDQVDQMRTTREAAREQFRGYDEKLGDAQQYRLMVDVWRIRNGMKPMVWR